MWYEESIIEDEEIKLSVKTKLNDLNEQGLSACQKEHENRCEIKSRFEINKIEEVVANNGYCNVLETETKNRFSALIDCESKAAVGSLYTSFKPVTFESNGNFHLEVSPGQYVLLSEVFKSVTEMKISDEEALEAWSEFCNYQEEENIEATVEDIVDEIRRGRIVAATKRKELEALEADEGVKKSKAKDGVVPSSARPEVVVPPRKITVPIKPSERNIGLKETEIKDTEIIDKIIKEAKNVEKKQKAPQKFKYSQKGPLLEINTEKLMDKIFGEPGPITLSVDELLAISPMCQKRMHNTIKTWKIPTELELEEIAKNNQVPLKATASIARDIFNIMESDELKIKILSGDGDISELPSAVVSMMKWNGQALTKREKDSAEKTMERIRSFKAQTAPRDPTFWTNKEFNSKNHSLVGSLATIRHPYSRDLQYSTIGSPHIKFCKFQEGFIVKTALIDSGAELVVCSFPLAMEATRSEEIDNKVTMVMWDVNGGKAKMYGIIKNAKITPVDGYEYDQCCWIAPELNKSAAALLLGMPFIMKSQLQLIPDIKGNMFARLLKSGSKTERVNLKVHHWDSERNHIYRDPSDREKNIDEEFIKLDGEIIDIENSEVVYLEGSVSSGSFSKEGFDISESSAVEADFL